MSAPVKTKPVDFSTFDGRTEWIEAVVENVPEPDDVTVLIACWRAAAARTGETSVEYLGLRLSWDSTVSA